MNPQSRNSVIYFGIIILGFVTFVFCFLFFVNSKSKPLEIKGKVFVVLRDSKAIPLPLVKIYILSAQDTEKLISKQWAYNNTINLKHDQLLEEEKELEIKLSKDTKFSLMVKKERLLMEAKSLTSKILDVSINAEDVLKLKLLLKRDELTEFNLEQFDKHINTTQVDRDAERYAYRQIYKKIDSDLLIKLNEQLRNYQNQYLSPIRQKIKESQKLVDNIWDAERLSYIPEEMRRSAAGEGVTDDKGEFSISINKLDSEKFYIFANAERELILSSKFEFYHWAKLASKSDLNILSNNNMLNDGMLNNEDIDCIWRMGIKNKD